MFFRAQNLGPLRDAEVDLSKDLIVLAGPNNSGKTYLAWSVYGLLHRSRSATRNALLDPWVRRLVESPDHTIDLGELFAQVGAEMLESIADEYKTSLHLCFAAESAQFAAANVSLRVGEGDMFGHESRFSMSLTKFGLASKPVVWSMLRRYVPGSVCLEWAMFEQLDQLQLFVAALREGVPAPTQWHATTTSLVTSLTASERESLDWELNSQSRSAVRSWLFPHCTLFPAERIAVNIFAKELTLKRTELVDEMVDADLDGQTGAPMDLVRRKAGRYPWPIRDSLKTANDLANLSKEKGPFAPLADEIESAVLGGEVVVSETGEMLYAPHGAAGSRLQMHLTASVVKSLSSLVFYFRYLARRGDFIIIDEPELNLHPDNQRKITRLLAKAVHLGFKVMISTHSDYVIRELNHLVMLSKLPEGEAQTLGYDPQSALTPEQLGVYLFNEQHAQPVPVEETGFSIKTIDDVVNQLNADEQRLYARLSE
jgi:energy-coupling factor transporter ATP-binding protein EcfA2